MADTITFRPTDQQGNFIEKLIAAGDFANQSEVIRTAIRLLQEQQAKSKLTQLRAMLKEGEDSPRVDGWNGEEFLSRMKKKHGATRTKRSQI